MNVYSDGACSLNGKINAKAGIGIYIQETKQTISEPIEKVINDLLPNLKNFKHTNNIAELLAILKAISIIDLKNKINIYSDSIYSIKCLTIWYKKWEVNDWKTAGGKPVLNKEIIQEILKYTKLNNNIKFIYTPAHRVKPIDDSKYHEWYGNKMADELACKSII